MIQKIIRIGSSAGVLLPKKELQSQQLRIGDEIKVSIEPVKRSKSAAAYPDITAHGRFQPPLHINHWNYLKEAFKLADHVRILITNPYPQAAPEAHDDSASWRSQPTSNPFTYEERVFMYQQFFENMGIPKQRYSIEPFDITNPESFKVLDPAVPNLVNVYSEWSAGKVQKFKANGLTVLQLDQPKTVDVSGTQIREIITGFEGDVKDLSFQLIEAGFMPEAVPGLLEVLSKRSN